MNKAAIETLIVVAGAMFLFWWPFAMIWSINTLFGTNIPMTLKTWVATVALVTVAKVCFMRSKD